MAHSYWLFKTEPHTFSIDDLAAAPERTTSWEGVRNYQARNLLRDEMREGDRVLVYHSGKDPAVMGTARIVRGGYPDHFAWDPEHHYYDPKGSPEEPRWYMVDIRLDQRFERPLPLSELRGVAALAEMELLRKGSRLSVQRVRESEWSAVLKKAGAA